MIPIARPFSQYETSRAEIDRALSDVLESGSYMLGPHVAAFEHSFAEYTGTSYAIGVNSGTDAITLCLRALGIGPGDRVITVSHSALATVAAVLASGATPVLIDVNPATYTLDPNQLEAVIDRDVKAIVPVHLYGNVADMTAICEIASQWEIPVVEDCAQAAGAHFAAARVGSLGRAGCFSFYPTKNLGALGDAGAVVTNDPQLADRVTRLRQYGWDEDRIPDRPGFNSRLDELQAAVLTVKLAGLDTANERRGEIAKRYSVAFSHLPVATPAAAPGATHVYHLYVIATRSRATLRRALEAYGVQTAVHYPTAIHQQPGYAQEVEVPLPLTETERVVDEVLSLPMYPELTDADVETVIGAVMDSHKIIGIGTL